MTERGLPIVGGAPACPFVAFEDDRDERATSPDHRHRCYAEGQPAPRALAHQEAYCLSSAFPVCPTFQDWARREAARARTPDLPPAEEDEDDALPLVDDRPPRRGSREAWAAPPPWLRGAGSAGPPPAAPGPNARPAGHDDEGMGGAAGAGAAAAGAAAAAGGLSGSFADRLASDRRALDPGPVEPGDWDDEEPPAAVAPPARQRHLDDRSRDLGGPTDDDADEDVPIARSPRRRERLEAGSDPIEGRRERDVAPSWERPPRLEAYPTLRSRRLSSSVLTSVGLGLIALLIAAAALFFLPQLLNLGGAPGGASPTPSVAGSVTPSGETAAPSQVPTATPFLYTVLPNDSFFKIAKKFGVDFNALIDANKDTHPNPNILNVGDVLIIPTSTPSEIPGASVAASP